MEKKYLTAEEVGKLLNRSAPAIRNLVLRRKIPFRRVGGRRLLFIRKEIESWVEDAPGKRLVDLEQEI